MTIQPITRLLAAGALFVAAVVPAAIVHAQGTPDRLQVLCNYNAFAYTDSSAIVEFAVQFPDRALTYRAGKSGEQIGRLYTRMIFQDLRGKEPTASEWETAVPKPAADAPSQLVVSQQGVVLAPGVYKVQVFSADAWEPRRADSLELTVTVPLFDPRRIQLSDLEIARDLYPSDETGNPFVKNGYYVLPDVSAVITAPFLVLNTYVEIYNIDRVATSEFNILYRLANDKMQVFYERMVSIKRTNAKSVLDVQTIPLDSLPSGTYHIAARVYNGLARFATDSAMVYRPFHLVNPEIDSAMMPLAGRPLREGMGIDTVADPLFSGLHENELDEEYAKVRCVATEQEKELWASMKGTGPKSRFLTLFWARRDQTPSTPENEDRESYYKRLAEARALYSSPMSPKGWDSDRGRILLQYGKPDNVERHFQDFNRKPYEIWSYNALSYDFVFVDRTQTGFYKLVHSTAPSEVHYENWERDFTPLNKNWKDN